MINKYSDASKPTTPKVRVDRGGVLKNAPKKETLGQPTTNTTKIKTKPKSDSPVKASVKGLQNAILKYKQALESLDIGSKANPGKQFSVQTRLDDKYSPNFQHPEFMEGAIRSMTPYSGLGGEIKPLTEQDRKNREEKEMLGGTNPLGNFLVKNYLNTEGISYSHTDVNDKDRKDQSVAPYDFRELVKTIGQIGTPKPERKPTHQEILLQKQIDNILKKYDPKKIQEFKNKVNELAKNYYNSTGIFTPKSRHDANNSALKLKIYQNEYNKLDKAYNINNPTLIKLNNNLSALKTKLDSEYENKNPGLGEEKIDGIFEQRTLNALQTISGITTALINFSKDMGKEVTDLSSELTKYNQILNVFKRVISRRDPVQQDAELKEKIVNALTETVYKQADFISEEFKQIIEAPEVKSFVTQEHSFMSFNKYNSDPQKEAKESESMFKERLEGNTLKPDLTPYVNAYKQTFQDGTAGIKVNFKNKELVFSYESLWTTSNLANAYKSAFGKNPTREELEELLTLIEQSLTYQNNMRHYQRQVEQGYRQPQAPAEPRRTPFNLKP